MAAQPFAYDRVKIYIDSIPYLPDGEIRNFTLNAGYNTRLVQGFSPNGKATMLVVGNSGISGSWEEYLVTQDKFINLRQFFIANPNAIITIVPTNVLANQPVAPQFTMTTSQFTNVSISASGEGQEAMRSVSFIAVDSSNT